MRARSRFVSFGGVLAAVAAFSYLHATALARDWIRRHRAGASAT